MYLYLFIFIYIIYTYLFLFIYLFVYLFICMFLLGSSFTCIDDDEDDENDDDDHDHESLTSSNMFKHHWIRCMSCILNTLSMFSRKWLLLSLRLRIEDIKDAIKDWGSLRQIWQLWTISSLDQSFGWHCFQQVICTGYTYTIKLSNGSIQYVIITPYILELSIDWK